MLEHAIYSVISPEGASSILWREAARAEDAATNMKITAQDLLRFGIIDAIVHRAAGRRPPRPRCRSCEPPRAMPSRPRCATSPGLDRDAIRAARTEKFLAMGRKI